MIWLLEKLKRIFLKKKNKHKCFLCQEVLEDNSYNIHVTHAEGMSEYPVCKECREMLDTLYDVRREIKK